VKLDAVTLATLYREEGRALLSFCARRTLDVDLALDLVGEAFAVAFERRGRFRGSSREEAVAWLYSIARTLISHHFRRVEVERRALRRLGVEPPVMGDEERREVERLAGLDALRTTVAGELDALPLEQRLAVQLRVVEELAYPQIAARLGVSQPAARQRVSRGLRTLAQRLAPMQEVLDAG
jgi:RNA polymerase sigma-70 factor, ECF subfamily